MRVVIPGGTGNVGGFLERWLTAAGHDVVVLSRRATDPALRWDGASRGDWWKVIDGADAVINLAGRSVDCRYDKKNLTEMYASRVDSTAAVGEAIHHAARPPAVWLQMSTATIYAHRYDAANDEANGEIGGREPDVPGYWRMSIDIARAWEQAQALAETPKTRKVALRTAMVMSADRGSVFDVLLRLVRFGLGGTIGDGKQFMSWIHGDDFARAIEFIIDRDDITGPINLAAPHPLPQREFMKALRAAWGMPIGLPATRWMVAIGAAVLRTDTELLLKSRRVVPGRLLDAGFAFRHPAWPESARDLVRRWQAGGSSPGAEAPKTPEQTIPAPREP